jgi:hypothetical protein
VCELTFTRTERGEGGVTKVPPTEPALEGVFRWRARSGDRFGSASEELALEISDAGLTVIGGGRGVRLGSKDLQGDGVETGASHEERAAPEDEGSDAAPDRWCAVENTAAIGAAVGQVSEVLENVTELPVTGIAWEFALF